MKKLLSILISVLIISALILGSCGAPEPEETTTPTTTSPTQTISPGETHGSTIALVAPSGTITFSAMPPSVSPRVDVPEALDLVGLVGTAAQASVTVTETSGLWPLQGVSVSTTDLWDQNGGVVTGTLLDVSPSSFTVPAGDNQSLDLYIDLEDLAPGVYLGAVVTDGTHIGLAAGTVAFKHDL